MLAGMPASDPCIKAFSETDFTEDLVRRTKMILHGDDDQIGPILGVWHVGEKIVRHVATRQGGLTRDVHDGKGKRSTPTSSHLSKVRAPKTRYDGEQLRPSLSRRYQNLVVIGSSGRPDRIWPPETERCDAARPFPSAGEGLSHARGKATRNKKRIASRDLLISRPMWTGKCCSMPRYFCGGECNPSSINASCTAGRAATRSMKATSLGHRLISIL